MERQFQGACAIGAPSVGMGRSMRVLLRLRPNYRLEGGDDADMALGLREALGRSDISIDIATRATQPLRNYDLVHCVELGCPHEAYQTAMNALAWDRPFVLTPLYWDHAELSRVQDTHWGRSPRPKHLVQVGWEEQLATLEHTDVMLPSGQTERLGICREFGVDPDCVIVPASVPADVMTAKEVPSLRERYGGRDFVLSVGRIEDRKNQWTLIRACEQLSLPLVLVGSASMDQLRYLADCKRGAGPNTYFVSGLERGDLLTHYATAKVHAMASWFELPGLSTLEAAAAGANVVSTNRGTAEDHLGELAWYCDPADVRSVTDAVRAAYEAPRRARQQVIDRVAPGWAKSAEAVVHAYELACGRPKRPPSPRVLAMLLLTKEHAREHELKRERYRELIQQIVEVASTTVPRDATTIVVSKGDEELLKLNGRRAWHFPQTEGGMYAGHYPADSGAAIAHLEALRAKGGDFLLFPNTAFWWLDHYQELREHLDACYRCIWSSDRCIVYQLSAVRRGGH